VSTVIDGVLITWYLLTAASLVFLVYDLTTNTPAGNVMKLAWVLVVAYTGPIGLFIYLLSCRQPLPESHDEFIKAHWKQATGSLLHCVAGDATGIIFAAAFVHRFGLPNGIDIIIEYLAAFVVGLLVFQALFMLAMYGGNYWLAVRKTFFAETVSMNMVMVGMIPVMVILMNAVPGAHAPTNPEFWGVMSLATLAGMITAYPINSWMVARGLKHGMMTAVPRSGSNATQDGMGGMEMTQDGHGSSHQPDQEDNQQPDHEPGHEHSQEHDHEHDEMGDDLPPGQAVLMLVGTFALFALSLWITDQFVPIVLG